MLSALLVSGALDRISAVVVGDFTDCPDSHRVSVQAVLDERLSALHVPVVRGLCCGHGRFNEFIPLGVAAELDASAGRLVIGDAAPG
jgi:muramoyltetrapeptide carboxypeptidase